MSLILLSLLISDDVAVSHFSLAITEMPLVIHVFTQLHNLPIFAALEWSNNFMAENWTADPGRTAVSGRGETATLSSQSKTTANRKKAVILLVNKPDTFNSSELTYLGMAADMSERYQTEREEVTEYENARISGNLEYKDGYYGAYDKNNSKTGTLTVSHKEDLRIYIEPIDYALTTHHLENLFLRYVNLGKKMEWMQLLL